MSSEQGLKSGVIRCSTSCASKPHIRLTFSCTTFRAYIQGGVLVLFAARWFLSEMVLQGIWIYMCLLSNVGEQMQSLPGTAYSHRALDSLDRHSAGKPQLPKALFHLCAQHGQRCKITGSVLKHFCQKCWKSLYTPNLSNHIRDIIILQLCSLVAGDSCFK